MVISQKVLRDLIILLIFQFTFIKCQKILFKNFSIFFQGKVQTEVNQ